MHRFSLCAVVAAACLLAACTAPAPSVKPSQVGGPTAKQAFGWCENEAVVALTLARQYLVVRKGDQGAVTELLDANDTEARKIADELFAGVKRGQIRHHPVFAADKLIACTNQYKMPVGKSREEVSGCFASVDIPFFVYAFKSGGAPRAEAVRQTKSLLKDTRLYPAKLIEAAATDLYDPQSNESADHYQKAWFWTCLYRKDWAHSKA